MADSPAKKLDFGLADKENSQLIPAPIEDINLNNSQPDAVKDDKPSVAATIKASEADEPLLQENPHRFVLFPIKYHEVCVHDVACVRGSISTNV